MNSTLKNIFFSTLYHSKDIKEVTNKKIFSHLIQELNELSSRGLTIKADGKTRIIYFQLGLVIGDNLGLNRILGFVQSFSSGSPCRICRATISEIRHLTKEVPELLRNSENYKKDIDLNNFSVTGIHEESAWDLVKNYNTIESPCLDFLHDWPEGVIVYAMVNILNDLIYEFGVCPLENLNLAIKEFEEKNVGISNKIPIIKKEHIKTKKKLKMSAAEILRFVKYFSVLIADKIKETKFFDMDASDDSDLLDCNDEDSKNVKRQKIRMIWDLYKTLRQIVDVITSPRLHAGQIKHIDARITHFLDLYKLLYGDLIYKLHNAIHVKKVLEKNGPLVHCQTARYESKHRPQKQTAVSTNCRINLTKTICLRNQLQLAYLTFTESFCSPNLICDSYEEISVRTKNISKFKNFSDWNVDEAIYETDRLTYKGIDYVTDLIVVTEILADDLICFSKIKKIYFQRDMVCLLIRRFQTLAYDENYGAFSVRETLTFDTVEQKNLPDVHPCLWTKKEKIYM